MTLAFDLDIEWPAVSAAAASLALVVAFLTYLRGRSRIRAKGWMETSGYTRGRVTNAGSAEVTVTQLELVARTPLLFRLRRPLKARHEGVSPVDARSDRFSECTLTSHAQVDRYFEFEDDRAIQLPSRRLTGPAFVARVPSRNELRIWATVPGKRPKSGRVEQLKPGQYLVASGSSSRPSNSAASGSKSGS